MSLFWRVAGCAALLECLMHSSARSASSPASSTASATSPSAVDYQEKTEWTFARLMYPPASWRTLRPLRPHGRQRLAHGNAIWTQDYPARRPALRASRAAAHPAPRRSVEQPVNLDEGDVYDWPWLYAVQVGHWNLTDKQATAMREYLLRGGFFMCDDFWGEEEWEVFLASMNRVFPDREVVELPNDAGIFHAVYDLDDRYQVASRDRSTAALLSSVSPARINSAASSTIRAA